MGPGGPGFLFIATVCSVVIVAVTGVSTPNVGGEDMYCGADDCYSVLGLQKLVDVSHKDLKKAYRRLALKYHPDKNKDADASDKFLQVARAFEALSENKDDYDYYLRHPEEAMYNQMRFYRYHYAPKTDLRFVVSGVLLLITVVKYIAQKNAYSKMVAGWKKLPRVQAWAREEVLKTRGGKMKVTRAVEKEKLLVEINAFLDEKAATHLNVMGARKKPEFMDLFFVQLLCSPWWATSWIYSEVRLMLRMRKNTLTDEDKSLLTRRVLGLSKVQWEEDNAENSIDPVLKDDLLSREIWVAENYEAWKKSREEKFAQKSKGRYKQWVRSKKKR